MQPAYVVDTGDPPMLHSTAGQDGTTCAKARCSWCTQGWAQNAFVMRNKLQSLTKHILDSYHESRSLQGVLCMPRNPSPPRPRRQPSRYKTKLIKYSYVLEWTCSLSGSSWPNNNITLFKPHQPPPPPHGPCQQKVESSRLRRRVSGRTPRAAARTSTVQVDGPSLEISTSTSQNGQPTHTQPSTDCPKISGSGGNGAARAGGATGP